MKKLLLSLIAVITLVGCNAQEPQSKDIWLFHLGEPKEEVLKDLKKNHYTFQEVKDENECATITENPTINYLGVDWDKCSVFYNIDNDKVKAVLFTRVSPLAGLSDPLPSYKIKALQDSLSKKYGEMREVREPSETDSRQYVWYDDDLHITFVTMHQGRTAFIIFGKEVEDVLGQ